MKSGFTLVEILIVLVILGILAAIVIPQFSDASEEAKLAALVSNLHTIRTQIQIYKAQHNDNLPGTVSGVNFKEAMAKYTYKDGTLAGGPGPGVYGPYVLRVPENPFDDSNSVNQGNAGEEPDFSGIKGWIYYPTTGVFNACDSKEHFDL
jgi:general secretion pathway protein G